MVLNNPHPFLANEPATSKNKPAVPKGPRSISPGAIPKIYQVTNLDIDVTENCNLGCLYCFKGEMYGKHMSLDTMKGTLHWLLEAAGPATSVNCNFMGGEPTMRFAQIKAFVPWARRVGRARGKKVNFSMTTNLTLFTEEIRQFVDEFGFGVLMSIDGCPEVQDAQRPSKNGKPLSAVVARWARSMLETRPQAQARATLYPDHVGKLADSMRYIHELGFAESAVAASSYEDWTNDHFDVLDAQLKEIVEYIADTYREGRRLFNITAIKYYINKLVSHRRDGTEEDIVFQAKPCGAGRGYMMVDYTGDIWPCHRFDGADEAAGTSGAFRMGNIYNDGFHHDLQQVFVDFDHSTKHKDGCNTCPVNPVCGGYCPAANLSDTGSIYTPHDTYCRWSQTVYRSAERLYDIASGESSEMLKRLTDDCRTVEGTGEK